jgi:hypothetical protein
MVVGSDTFTGDLAARVGLSNVFAKHSDRYPHVTPDQILARGAELVVLPDEPYKFTKQDGPEAFPEIETVLPRDRDRPHRRATADVVRTVACDGVRRPAPEVRFPVALRG